MIEPFRYYEESFSPHEIERPVLCASCLNHKSREDPAKYSSVYCQDCPSLISGGREFGCYLCRGCEYEKHQTNMTRYHRRNIIVVGPGIRKKMLIRGDSTNFPKLFDTVKIQMRAKIFHNGQRIHKKEAKELEFITGLSGKSIHVQILGARNLPIGLNGTVNPSISYSFNNFYIGSTRIRYRNPNPNWSNETFIVPMNEDTHSKLLSSYRDPGEISLINEHKDMIRLDFHDNAWVNSSNLIGSIDISKAKLMQLALISNCLPIRLPIVRKNIYGNLIFKINFNKAKLGIKILYGKNFYNKARGILSKSSSLSTSKINNNYYVKVFCGDSFLGQTAIVKNSTDPSWEDLEKANEEIDKELEQETDSIKKKKIRERKIKVNNDFFISLKELILTEHTITEKIKQFKKEINYNPSKSFSAFNMNRMNEKFTDFFELPDNLKLIRFEIYEVNANALTNTTHGNSSFFSSIFSSKYNTASNGASGQLIGVTTLSIEQLHDIVPTLKQFQPYRSINNSIKKNKKKLSVNVSSPSTLLSSPIKLSIDENKDNNNKNILPAAAQLPPSFNSSMQKISLFSSIKSFFDSFNSPASPSLPPVPSSPSPVSSKVATPTSGPELPTTFSYKSLMKSKQQQQQQSQLPPSLSLSLATEENQQKFLTSTIEEENDENSVNSSLSSGSEKKDRSSQKYNSLPPSRKLLPNLPSQSSLSVASSNYSDQSKKQFLPPFLSKLTSNISISFVQSKIFFKNFNLHRQNTKLDNPYLLEDGNVEAEMDNAVEDFEWTPKTVSYLIIDPKIIKEDTDQETQTAPPSPIKSNDNFSSPPSPSKNAPSLSSNDDQSYIIVRLLPSNRGLILPGLDQAIQRMTIGELSLIKCRYDQAYGSFVLSSQVPPRSNIIFQIKLLSINNKGGLINIPLLLIKRIFRFVFYIFHCIVLLFLYIFSMKDKDAKKLKKKNKKRIKKSTYLYRKYIRKTFKNMKKKLFILLKIKKRKTVYRVVKRIVKVKKFTDEELEKMVEEGKEPPEDNEVEEEIEEEIEEEVTDNEEDENDDERDYYDSSDFDSSDDEKFLTSNQEDMDNFLNLYSQTSAPVEEHDEENDNIPTHSVSLKNLDSKVKRYYNKSAMVGKQILWNPEKKKKNYTKFNEFY